MKMCLSSQAGVFQRPMAKRNRGSDKTYLIQNHIIIVTYRLQKSNCPRPKLHAFPLTLGGTIRTESTRTFVSLRIVESSLGYYTRKETFFAVTRLEASACA